MAATLDDGVEATWPWTLLLTELTPRGIERSAEADAAVRKRVAAVLGLVDLPMLQAELTIAPWLDGAHIGGRWRATVVQTCGVTLEPFETALEGALDIRAVPPGSAALAATPEPGHDLEIDPDAEDPPDLIEGDRLRLGAYVVEDLALSIDPFPRKPGVAFEAPSDEGEVSPFAVLAKLKGRSPDA